jgi:tetratricopeptide (TPR) repeat protein
MRKFSSLVFIALLLALVACNRKEVEVSSVARAEAMHLATEAQLQTRLRDYAEAEKSLARAVELDPTVSDYWSALGRNRALKGDKSGAKKAYKRELELCEKEAEKSPKDAEAQLTQLRPLVLLNRVGEARKLIEKISREHPDNAELKRLAENKEFEKMIADPQIQEAVVK